MKRFRITTWVVSTVLAFGVLLAGTMASAGATTLARASSAPAKSAKKHKKASCPKGTHMSKGVCVKVKYKTRTVEVENKALAAEQAAKTKKAEEALATAESAKSSAESAKKTAEAGLATAEASKKAAEASLATAETAKKTAEAGLATAEAAKKKAEGELSSATGNTAAAEAAKKKAEEELKAANTKIAAEEEAKKKAEEAKKKAEEELAASKKKVEEEEKAKKTAEEAKKKAEEEAAAAKKKLEEKEKKEKEEKEALEKIEKEAAARIPKELGEVQTAEAGGTKAIEHYTEIPLAPAWTPVQLNAWPTGNWIGPEGGTTGDHFSKLKEITPSNVTQLKGDWMTGLDNSGVSGEGYSAEASPTEYGGVLYYITGADDVFAVSAASGHILWVHPGGLPTTVNTVCCGWDARGLSIGEGKVYVPLLSGSVEALNEETGELVWKTELGQPAEGLTVTSAPLYYEGMVFIGPVGSEYGVRGFMEAFEAKTGNPVWKHYNIPGEGETGHNSWPYGSGEATTGINPTGLTTKERETRETVADDEWRHGGATTWNAPTVDPKLHEILYSTANAGNDDEGYYRKGADLWSVSMLALNYETGEMKWGYQEVHHDIWDYDASNQPTMINVEIGGKKVEGIVQADKDGWAYFVNAETGAPVTGGTDLGIEEQAVPTNVADASYPTQPIPKMPPFYPQEVTKTELEELQTSVNSAIKKVEESTAEVQKHVEVVHGGYQKHDVFAAWAKQGEEKAEASSDALSGDNEAPSSYDPENGYYYVCSRKGLDYVYMTDDAVPVFTEGSSYAGADYIAAAHIGAPGYLTAYNMKTGEIAWMKTWEHECYSGITTTAGNLLITGTITGEMLVYNATTGEELLKFQLGATIGGAEAVYEYGGKERIGIYAGGNDFDFGGDTRGDLLWQLSLGGTLAQVTEKYYNTHHAEANATTHEEVKVPEKTADF